MAKAAKPRPSPAQGRRVTIYDLTDAERAAVKRAADAERRSVSFWIAEAVRLRLAPRPQP